MPQPAVAIQSPRPNQRDGIIETILIFEDRPVELDAHLERLAASVRALYGKDPPDTRELVISRARGGGLGRMRLTVSPKGDGDFDTSVVVAPFDPHNVFPTGEFVSELSTMVVDRGYGGHKWADRALLTRAEAFAPLRAVPLLVGEKGAVLEGSRANIFVVAQGRLSTPPLGGEILPGVTRGRVIEIAQESGIPVAQESFGVDTLRAADEVFLTGSLRGIEPATAIDGDPLPGEGPLTRELAAGLRERWFGAWL